MLIFVQIGASNFWDTVNDAVYQHRCLELGAIIFQANAENTY